MQIVADICHNFTIRDGIDLLLVVFFASFVIWICYRGKECFTTAKYITSAGSRQYFLALCHWEEGPVRLWLRCVVPRAE